MLQSGAASALFHLFLFLHHRPSQQEMTSIRWMLAGVDKRFDTAPLSTTTSSVTFCAMYCISIFSCASFNYYGQQKECQLLTTVSFLENDISLIDDQGWVYYKVHPPVLPSSASACPSGKFFLPYDVPGYLRPDPDVKGYTCSAHSWIVQKHNEGKTDCRLVLQYNTEFGGHDITEFANNQMDYKAAMAQCPDFNCIGMICNGQTNSDYLPTNCWMKFHTHLTFTDQSPVPHQNLHYWYTECNAP